MQKIISLSCGFTGNQAEPQQSPLYSLTDTRHLRLVKLHALFHEKWQIHFVISLHQYLTSFKGSSFLQNGPLRKMSEILHAIESEKTYLDLYQNFMGSKLGQEPSSVQV